MIRGAVVLSVALALCACDGGGDGRRADAGTSSRDAMLVPGDDAGSSPQRCDPPPSGASNDARDAFLLMNTLRTAMGVPCMTYVPEIAAAAAAHCAYYAANGPRSSCTQNPHSEVSTCDGFTGTEFWDRMEAAGYGGAPSFEVMHFFGDGDAATQGWVDSVWHRLPVLSPWATHAGYGGASGCDTMDFGRGMPAGANVVAVYPYEGQVDVPVLFSGNESPVPPAPAGGWPSGYPITIYTMGTLTTHTLKVDGETREIPHVWLDPDTDTSGLLSDAYFLYANEPLEPETRYRVQATGRHGSQPITLDWTFTTAR